MTRLFVVTIELTPLILASLPVGAAGYYFWLRPRLRKLRARLRGDAPPRGAQNLND